MTAWNGITEWWNERMELQVTFGGLTGRDRMTGVYGITGWDKMKGLME
jgi:hypothetical protein